MNVFIDGIDSWVVKAVAGGPQVKQIIGELKAIQRQGPRMIDDAFSELKKLHAKMMVHELPGTTAALAGVSSKVAREETQEAVKVVAKKDIKSAVASEKKLLGKQSHDIKSNKVTPNSSKTNTKKKAESKKRSWRSGVPAEHITDYYVKRKHINFSKVNNNGLLTEEHSTPHPGIDHLWSNPLHLTQPFVVGETKSSIFDSFALIAALPAEMQEKFQALRADEAANPVGNGRPNIFENEARDEHANQSVDIGRSGNAEAVRGGLNKPNPATKLHTQMSHAWIAEAVKNESLTESGRKIKTLIRQYREDILDSPELMAPYKRWIFLVTGRQLQKHRNSKGATHDIQIMMNLPNDIIRR